MRLLYDKVCFVDPRVKICRVASCLELAAIALRAPAVRAVQCFVGHSNLLDMGNLEPVISQPVLNLSLRESWCVRLHISTMFGLSGGVESPRPLDPPQGCA